jgi:hypothetical protein
MLFLPWRWPSWLAAFEGIAMLQASFPNISDFFMAQMASTCADSLHFSLLHGANGVRLR